MNTQTTRRGLHRGVSLLLLMLMGTGPWACGDAMQAGDAVSDSLTDASTLDVSSADADALGDAFLGETTDASVADAPPPFFTPSALTLVELDFSEEALATLEEGGGAAVVTGDLKIDGETIPGVQVERYGPDGTMLDMNEKPGFFLRLDPGGLGQGFEGYTSLILDNLHRDAGMIREHILNYLFRESGVPAPRTKYAWLTINGEEVGLYLMMEPMSDPLFEMEWFESSGILYWGKKDADLTQEAVGKLTLHGGDDPDRAQLNALVGALDEIGDDNILEKLNELIDMERFITFAGLEGISGIRRGYVNGRRNFAIFKDSTDGRWTFLPRELARTMREGYDPLSARGRVGKLCLKDLDCRLKLAEEYAKLAQRVHDLNLVSTILLSKSFLLDMASVDQRIEWTLDEVEQSIHTTAGFIAYQPEWVLANLQCADPTKVDLDGDGYSGCGADCNDEDPDVHPGAPEICNFIDDDCNGTLDDAPDCPACQGFVSSGGSHFDLCFQVKFYMDAEADCVARGGHLASIRSVGEQQEVVAAALGLWWTNWWIGFDDMLEEGTFLWTDGSEAGYTAWANGEPNDANGEDCTHFSVWAGGMWNDIPCDRDMPYVCRYPAEEDPDPAPVEEGNEGDVLEGDAALEEEVVDDAAASDGPVEVEVGPTEDLGETDGD